jgi:hypothetical protein
VPPRKGPYEAGGSEKAGRVMEPRNVYNCGQEDIPQGGTEGKADGVQWPEGSSPVAAGKAAVQLVKVQPCQVLGSGT